MNQITIVFTCWWVNFNLILLLQIKFIDRLGIEANVLSSVTLIWFTLSWRSSHFTLVVNFLKFMKVKIVQYRIKAVSTKSKINLKSRLYAHLYQMEFQKGIPISLC